MSAEKSHPERVVGPGSHRIGEPPPDSDLPLGEPPIAAEEVVPYPAADVGGMDAVPEEMVPANERVEGELDHAGLDVELPGEDQARAGGGPQGGT